MPISSQLFTVAIVLYIACGEVGERSAEPFQRSSSPVQKDIQRGNRSDDPFRALISRTNARIATLLDSEHVFFLDIGPQFLSGDGTLTHDIMPDYLHPGLRGYEIWAAAIKSKVDSLEGSNKH